MPKIGYSLRLDAALKSLGESWACGHPISRENIAPNGGRAEARRAKCRICHRKYSREWMERNRETAELPADVMLTIPTKEAWEAVCG